MKNQIILTIVLLFSATATHAQGMYADSLQVGRTYFFSLQDDSLTQQVFIRPIGKAQISYHITVVKGNICVNQLAGIAQEGGNFQSTGQDDLWWYDSVDGGLTITIHGNDATSISIYQRPITDKKMPRVALSATIPVWGER